MTVGSLGALAGALLGGGGGAAKGAIGGGVMAFPGGLAVSAVKNLNRPVDANDTKSMPLGLREAQDDSEEEALQNNAKLVLRAMINAAKSDGQIGQTEMQRITEKLQEAGADQEARNFVLAEMGKPLDLDGIIRDVRDPMVGAQVYAASLLSIEVDTAAEQDYLRRLAAGLQLGPEAVARIHQISGVS
ncbi:MAG: tellurite resistance TerB family protein [Desulfobacterales bacterium]